MKKNDKAMISFVTPNYNDSKTIERMVDSIMDQDYPYVEQIIVDDGSTDDSKKVLKKLEKKYKGKLRVFFLDKNRGACYARNFGAKQAKGKYLSFLPADAKLYPGMARIWVEALEDNPQYDFIYGGYKFTDDNYNEMFSYMSDDFDPYFLQVNNYIDGSFPLSKELFDKMGGWDESIKSLQDWDFWLNAVINHNAKGLFSQQVFFETTFPHPGGLSDDSNRNWIDRVKAVKVKYGIDQKKICVTGNGAPFHAKNVAKMLGADYLPQPAFKPHKYECIYVIGFFGNVAQAFFNTGALRIVHWIGSDIIQLKSAPEQLRNEVIKWIENNVDINLVEFEQTRKELEELGIKARIVPFPPQRMYEPMPLPEKFTVACYIPYNNHDFYQPDLIKDIALGMKNVDWKFFGDPTLHGKKDNIEHMGVLNKEEMEELIKNSSCILRLTPHDGLPLSVVEFVTAGRNAITTVDLKYCKHVKIKKSDVIKAIREVKKLGVNNEGSKYYRELCDEKRFVDTINGFLVQDVKYWWEKMSKVWPTLESNYGTPEDMTKIIKEVKELKVKNIVDLGCGTGRWCDLLPVEKYLGVDFSKDLIKVARDKHPEHDFMVSDINDFAEKVKEKYDAVFTFTSLLHVKPEDIERYCNSIKKIARKAVIVEPARESQHQGKERMLHPEVIKLQKEDPNFIFNIKYTWFHDYLKYFDVKKVIELSDGRNIFVIDL